MIARGISRLELEAAAARVGVVADTEALSGSGLRHRVKLFPLLTPTLYTPGGHRKRGEAGDARYQRVSVGWGTAGRRVHAVCWHGFRDFFRAAFTFQPEAVFRTAVATWKGSADFEARFADTASKNIGPPIAPVAMASACKCGHEIQFGKLLPDGQLVGVRMIRQADIQRCPHLIMAPEHYRENGTCRCDDRWHSEMREWGYRWRKGRWAA